MPKNPDLPSDTPADMTPITRLPARRNRTKAWKSLDAALTKIERDTEAVSRKAMDLEETTWEESAELLARLRDVTSTLKDVDAGLVRYIAAAWRTERIRGFREVPGVGVFEVHRSANRRAWQSRSLAKEVVDARMRLAEGVVPDPQEVAGWILDAAGVGYWKVTVLKPLGIDPDDYCHTEYGSSKVEITR